MTSNFTMINEENELHEHEALTQESETALEELEVVERQTIDYTQFTKEDYAKLLDEQLAIVKAEKVRPSDFKRVDEVLKESKSYFDQMKRAEREAARLKFVSENESEEGFEYKFDEQTQQLDALYRQIRDSKNAFFQELDKSKEKNFSVKTELLQKLRELVDAEEHNTTSQGAGWQAFQKIQNDWKEAGNINSPHNSTLWATYHALVDRYYSNRNIHNELKDLDRKRNATLKSDLVAKVEAIAKSLVEAELTKTILEEANHLFEEYKQVGPAPKAEQEALWQRMKVALDVVYDKRRAQSGEQKQVLAQNYELKSKIYEELVPYTSFTSSSINEWNDKTKVVMGLQDQWTNAKGAMLREEGKELSRKFWAALKTFFHNKGEFFKQLESKRDQNLKLKIELCEQAEAIVASGDESATSTDKIIELQKQWKQIGQVPEKQKESIFKRFKEACDGYFDRKRNKNKEVDREFVENLALKETLIANIESAAQAKEGNLEQLNEFKSQWSQVGFVPKKDMQAINKRYIAAVNAYVSAIGALSGKEKERVILKNEVEMTTSGESSRDLQKREADIRRKMTNVENEITILRNNIEFFARSKNSEKLRAEVDKKIEAAAQQLAELKHQLKIVREAI